MKERERLRLHEGRPHHVADVPSFGGSDTQRARVHGVGRPGDPVVETLSVVLPVHNESGCLRVVLAELDEIATARFEVIAVDDGSTDGSDLLLEDLAEQYEWLRVIRLRANRGQTHALASGIRVARGDVIVTMDADGQNDPADIPILLDRMVRTGADVVAGRRVGRHEPLSRRAVSFVANAAARRISGVHVHDTGCTLKAFRAETIKNLRLLRDDHRFMPALAASRGARVDEVDVKDRPRLAGRSHYGFRRVPAVFADLLGMWFSHRFEGRPLRAAGWCALMLITVWFAIGALLVATHHAVSAIAGLALGGSMALIVLVAGALVEESLRSKAPV